MPEHPWSIRTILELVALFVVARLAYELAKFFLQIFGKGFIDWWNTKVNKKPNDEAKKDQNNRSAEVGSNEPKHDDDLELD